MVSHLVFVDTETTGLEAHHQAYEFSWMVEGADARPRTLHVPHTLIGADARALEVGRYFERGFRPFADPRREWTQLRHDALLDLRGATLVGSNPNFDAGFMTRQIFGVQVWSHRLINVAEGAMWTFGWDRPRGLAAVADAIRELGIEIPEPDHTAAGDVAATAAVYYALRVLRDRWATG